MQLTYAVLGSGAMGLRFGLLLKEHLGAQVDFIDTWEEHIKTVIEQGGGLPISRWQRQALGADTPSAT